MNNQEIFLNDYGHLRNSAAPNFLNDFSYLPAPAADRFSWFSLNKIAPSIV
jgi:hypothetical protein